MPTPLHISFARAFVCTPPVSALRSQFSNSPASKSCEPEAAHLGAPQRGPEPKLGMLSTAVIRLYAHDVADLSRCRILAQTAIEVDKTREQNLLSFEKMTRLRCNVERSENLNEYCSCTTSQSDLPLR